MMKQTKEQWTIPVPVRCSVCGDWTAPGMQYCGDVCREDQEHHDRMAEEKKPR